MASLDVTRNYEDGEVLTQADLDIAFDDVETFLNATKINDDNIQTGGIDASIKLLTGSVTAGKLGTDSVTTIKIQDLAVTTGKLADEAVTTAKIDDEAVTSAKLAAGLRLPVGMVAPFAGASAPSGWLLCDGSRVSRTTYADLFALIGTLYGVGDSSTTFNLPDYRGQFLRGKLGFTSKTFATSDVDTTTDEITISAGHGINRTGFPIRFSSTTTLPTGLSASTTYYAVYVSATVFKVATTEANAIAGTTINITGVGSGTHTVSQYADPDAASRTAMTPGANTGDNVGSVQEHAFTQHTHSTTFYSTPSDAGGIELPDLGASPGVSPLGVASGNASAGGGNETRPRNVYVNYIIKT